GLAEVLLYLLHLLHQSYTNLTPIFARTYDFLFLFCHTPAVKIRGRVPRGRARMTLPAEPTSPCPPSGGEYDSCQIPDSRYERAETRRAFPFSHVDFCSGFSTVFQGVRRILTLSRDS